MDGKRYSVPQDIGEAGELHFRRIARTLGLIVVPVTGSSDVGIDCFCQTRTSFDNGIAIVGGGVVAVSVRSTTKEDERVKLTRDDAAHLLNLDTPVMLALVSVDLAADECVLFIRPLDKSFADDLLSLLDSDQETTSFTPRSRGFVPTDSGRSVVASLCRPNSHFEVRLHVLQHRARKHLPEARIAVHQSADGVTSIIHSPRISKVFDTSTEESRSRLRLAEFGHPSEVIKRLTSLDIRSDLAPLKHALPGLVSFEGTLPSAASELTAQGPRGSATLLVEWREGTGWHGFVHPSGFSIQVSDPAKLDGVLVHHLTAAVDPEHPIDLRVHEDLVRFLLACRRDADVIFGTKQPSPSAPARVFKGLIRLNAFVSARDLVGDPMPQLGHLVAAIPSDDSVHTLLFWAKAREGIAFSAPWQFYYGDDVALDLETSDFVLPICANLGDGAVVMWMRSDVRFFRKGEEVAGLCVHNLRLLFHVEGFPFAKATPWPELVVSPSWSSIPLSPDPMDGTDDVSAWDVEPYPAEPLIAHLVEMGELPRNQRPPDGAEPETEC